MATKTLPSVMGGTHGLSRYLEEIRKFPMLEPGEEYMLAKRWQEHEDSEAAHKLVTSNLSLVTRIAMVYCGYGLPIGEVIFEGNVGLFYFIDPATTEIYTLSLHDAHGPTWLKAHS